MKKIALSLVIIVFLSIFAGCLEIDNNGSNTLKPKLLDSDKDGVSDIDDAFPYDPAASKDTDGDGYPDCWNENKDQSDSTTIPPLELDEFPSDPKAHKDTDHDGVADYYDINDFVNLSIDITIEKFKVTGWVDILWRAQVYLSLIHI